MNDYQNSTKRRLYLSPKVKVGAAVVVVGGLYVLHRKKMDAVITVLTEQSLTALQNESWTSFDSGVQYGLDLAKSNVSLAKEITEINNKYGFAAFDKAT